MEAAHPAPRLRALPPNTWWWVLAGVVMLPAAAPLGVLAYGLVSGVVTTVPIGRLLELAANTGALGAAVTSTSLLIGGASAWLVSRTDLPGKKLATVLVLTPFAVPSFVGALALLGATGADGILSTAWAWMGGGVIRYPSGFWAAWLVLTLISVPLVHLAVAPAVRSINPTLEEAARGLGAGRLKVFWAVTLPQLRSSLTAGALLVGLYTLSDFGAVSLLRYDTFTRAIYLEYAGRVDRRPALGLAAVLAGVANATPKSGEGEIEMIRMLKSTKDSAVKARTQAVNQMKALVVTAPARLRETLDGLTATALAARCKSFRPGRLEDPAAAAKYTLRSLACRCHPLDREIRDLQAELERLTRRAAPALVSIFGVGPDTAAALLISAGSNPQRIHSEAAFASLCGVSPIPASSGKTNRHRLNRGGDRQANATLYRVVLVRLSHDLRTREYMHRRTAEGMSKTEVIRCLKRYVVREVYSALKVPSKMPNIEPRHP